VAAEQAEELLSRLARLAEQPSDVVDMYERQISRCESIPDRVRALGRAAQVAAERGLLDRASALFDIVLSGSLDSESLTTLEDAARAGDMAMGGDGLRRALCAAMATGGQSARDGGKTRGSLLRRAAAMVHRDLQDVSQAFAWLGEALVAHVDAPTLDALEELAHEVGAPQRAEETLGRALGEVFEAPLVRELLARRARLRRDSMADNAGAAADLRKLYELAPADHHVAVDLAALYTDLGDHHALVSLYEDQILRTKDPSVRADLARRVAHMWETELVDAREAADAWRRVLRLNPRDAEAMAGLERMKAAMLRRSSLPETPARSTPELPADSAQQPASEAPSQRSTNVAVASSREDRASSPRPLDDEASSAGEAGRRGAWPAPPSGKVEEARGSAPGANPTAKRVPAPPIPAAAGSGRSLTGATGELEPGREAPTSAIRPDDGATPSAAAVSPSSTPAIPGDDDVLVADEVAVMIEDEPVRLEEKPAQPSPRSRRKKSVPPPLPRG
jgi:tetratricopeptide (TPR) repeat protein